MASFKIGITTDGELHYELVKWLTENNRDPIIEKTYSPASGRDKVTEKFLRESDAEWLVYLDDDTKPLSKQVFDCLDEDNGKVLIIPYLFTHLKWSFRLEDTPAEEGMRPMQDYDLKDDYDFKNITLFGGSGICIHRSVLEEMGKPYWVEPSGNFTSEDFLFAKRLMDEGVQAKVVYGSALHHYKDDFDLLKTFRN